jgi:hypothetical protein
MSRACLFTLAFTLPVSAGAGDSGLSSGTALLDLRLRQESVDDDAFSRHASALTLRTRLGWRSTEHNGLFVLIEAEDVRALDEDYNSSANGRTRYPLVADPEGSEWNQAYLGWKYAEGSQLTLGRQRLLLDNQRYIGNVGWRQNEQTFDALSLQHQATSTLTLRYAWLDRVQRIFGNEHPDPLAAEQNLSTHLLNAAWALPAGSLVGYGYFHENQDLPATSTRSLGLRFSGSRAFDESRALVYGAELATQAGWRDAPDSGSIDYAWVELGLRQSGHTLKLGQETLGSNGRRAFQTPLATGHAFNGWADRFLSTPVDGLRDRHLKLDGPLGALRYALAWHDFAADRGGADYGNELDAQLAWPFATGWNAMAKFAEYRSDGFGADSRKFWLSIEYRH